VRGRGVALFELARAKASRASSANGRTRDTAGDPTTWVKVKNPDCTQMRDRAELFDVKPKPARFTAPRLSITIEAMAPLEGSLTTGWPRFV